VFSYDDYCLGSPNIGYYTGMGVHTGLHSHSLNSFVCNTIRFFQSKPMPSPVNDLLMSPVY